MIWFLYALLSAATNAAYLTVSKKMVSISSRYWAAATVSAMAAIFAGIALASRGIPALGPGFWPAFLTEAVLEALGMILVFKALEKTDVSLAAPIMALTPVFLLITSPLMTGEIPSTLGTFGVLLAVLGMYLLSYKGGQKSVWAPFSNLWYNEGTRLMLLVAALYSITANSYKLAVVNSSPEFTQTTLSAVLAIEIGLLAILKKEKLPSARKGFLKIAGLDGLLIALSGLLLGYALSAGLTPYVISIRRLSVPAAVVFGHVFLGERNLGQRLFASLISFIGVVLMLWAG